MAAVFEYWLNEKDHCYWFHLLETVNGKVLVASAGGYSSIHSCISGIGSTVANSPFPENYRKRTGADGKFCFALRAGNLDPVNVSGAFDTPSMRDEEIELCRRAAPGAIVKRIPFELRIDEL